MYIYTQIHTLCTYHQSHVFSILRNALIHVVDQWLQISNQWLTNLLVLYLQCFNWSYYMVFALNLVISIFFFFGIFSVADVLLWKKWSVGIVLLISATALWLLFERAGYNPLSFAANVLLLLVVILFFWAKSASLLNRCFVKSNVFYCHFCYKFVKILWKNDTILPLWISIELEYFRMKMIEMD